MCILTWKYWQIQVKLKKVHTRSEKRQGSDKLEAINADSGNSTRNTEESFYFELHSRASHGKGASGCQYQGLQRPKRSPVYQNANQTQEAHNEDYEEIGHVRTSPSSPLEGYFLYWGIRETLRPKGNLFWLEVYKSVEIHELKLRK